MSVQTQFESDEEISWTPAFDTSAGDVSTQLLELAGDRKLLRFCSVCVMDEFETAVGTVELARDLSTGEICGLLLGEITGLNEGGTPIFSKPQAMVAWFAPSDADPEDAIVERLFAQKRSLH